MTAGVMGLSISPASLFSAKLHQFYDVILALFKEAFHCRCGKFFFLLSPVLYGTGHSSAVPPEFRHAGTRSGYNGPTRVGLRCHPTGSGVK